MASNKEMLNDAEFSALKRVVTSWYDEHSCLPMLKVLFRDHVKAPVLENITSTENILTTLCIRGDLSSGDFSIICDTIRITEHFGLQMKLKEEIASFPKVKEAAISKNFTPNRQQLMKLGMVLTKDNVKEIDKCYNDPPIEYDDSWHMINDLENRGEFDDMEKFIYVLDKQHLYQPFKALHQGILFNAEFAVLARVVSRWYDNNGGLPMLKVLFRDHLPNTQKLENIISTQEILSQSYIGGFLSENHDKNFSIISDAIRITNHFALEAQLNRIYPEFPHVVKGDISYNFSLHRQQLMQLGMVLSEDNVREIDKYYNEPLKEYDDSWHMISDLENRVKFEGENVERFIKLLRTLQLHRALKALKQDIEGPSLDIDRPTGEQEARIEDRSMEE